MDFGSLMPRGHVRHRADRRVVEASLEADRAERGVAVRDADAEAELVAEAPPFFDQRPIAARISSAICTAEAPDWPAAPDR